MDWNKKPDKRINSKKEEKKTKFEKGQKMNENGTNADEISKDHHCEGEYKAERESD